MKIENLSDEKLMQLAKFFREEINSQIYKTLVEKLMKCRALSDKNKRVRVVQRLGPKIAEDIVTNDVLGTEINSLVDTVFYYDHFHILIGIVCDFESKEECGDVSSLSSSMKDVVDFLIQISAQMPSKSMLAGRTAQPVFAPPVQPFKQTQDPICYTGREYHWDRVPVVNQFVEMVKGNPIKGKNLRVLAIQGSPETGVQSSNMDDKSYDDATFIKRLSTICKEFKPPVLYSRFSLRSDQVPIEIVKGILVGFKTMIGCKDDYTESNPKACMIIEQTLNKIAPKKIDQLASPFTPRGLAEELKTCITLLVQQFSVVILIQNFEALPNENETRKWFINDLLSEYLCRVEKLTVVVTGYEGLKDLRNTNETIHCILNLPLIDADDFYYWVTQGWQLNLPWFTQDFARKLWDQRDGNLFELWGFINAIRLLAAPDASSTGLAEP